MSSSSSSSASRRIQEENENPPLTGMNLGLQRLVERIIAERTTTRTNTQLRVPLIIDTIGCDITIDDIQLVKRELLNKGVDLKMDVNESQFLILPNLISHFCRTGDLLIVKLLFLIGADCTKLCQYNRSPMNNLFPMLVAAHYGHFDICKWLFEYGGDAQYQINKETTDGDTPLRQSYEAWYDGRDNEGKTCRWLLRNGGGQHLSFNAMRHLLIEGKEETNSNLLVLWMRENIQLHDTFILLLCGATTMITSSSLSSLDPDDGGTTRRRKHKHKRERKRNQERSLQILDGHPGIMELIGDYIGLIRGKEFRRLQEFNELVIVYNKD